MGPGVNVGLMKEKKMPVGHQKFEIREKGVAAHVGLTKTSSKRGTCCADKGVATGRAEERM